MVLYKWMELGLLRLGEVSEVISSVSTENIYNFFNNYVSILSCFHFGFRLDFSWLLFFLCNA